MTAHTMTHETVRPEKCPVISCNYHKKGFARKYDKNRHSLTHYRGTMICGFCSGSGSGSGSAAEKGFNRADVFKKHLTSVHGVEQTPPNSRKGSPSKSNAKLSSYYQDATGKCSTCGSTFNNAREFYEHLDDCVLRVVQEEEEFDFDEHAGCGIIKATKITSNRPIIGGNISKKTYKEGHTWSKGGGSIIGKSRKRRKVYPPSWGMATDK